MGHSRSTVSRNRQIFVPYNGKIADITHADTNKHTLDLQAALSETRKIIAIEIGATKISGSGAFLAYPNEGASSNMYIDNALKSKWIVIADGTNRLQYALSSANDDFDVYCFGYVVEV